jgi:hypothetical protein
MNPFRPGWGRGAIVLSSQPGSLSLIPPHPIIILGEVMIPLPPALRMMMIAYRNKDIWHVQVVKNG